MPESKGGTKGFCDMFPSIYMHQAGRWGQEDSVSSSRDAAFKQGVLGISKRAVGSIQAPQSKSGERSMWEDIAIVLVRIFH